MSEVRVARDPLVRLQQLWSWIPAFRAVAETEHLPSAARRLGVSPSALSRSIGLLEAELGCDLFARTGGRLRLTAEGQALLDAARASMRGLHSAVEAVTGEAFVGRLPIGVAGAVAVVHVLPALEDFGRAHPALEPEVRVVGPVAAREGLRSGALDVVFHSSPVSDPLLTNVRLGALSNGVYCGPASAFHGRTDVDAAAVLQAPFVAPPDGETGPPDGWPVHLPRRVTLRVDAMHLGVEVVLASARLAVLPDALAARHPTLWRLPVAVVPETPVFALHRVRIGSAGRVEALVACVGQRVAGGGA